MTNRQLHSEKPLIQRKWGAEIDSHICYISIIPVLFAVRIGVRNASTPLAWYGYAVRANITNHTMPFPPVITFSTNLTMACAVLLLPTLSAKWVEEDFKRYFWVLAKCSSKERLEQRTSLVVCNTRFDPIFTQLEHLLLIAFVLEDVRSRFCVQIPLLRRTVCCEGVLGRQGFSSQEARHPLWIRRAIAGSRSLLGHLPFRKKTEVCLGSYCSWYKCRLKHNQRRFYSMCSHLRIHRSSHLHWRRRSGYPRDLLALGAPFETQSQKYDLKIVFRDWNIKTGLLG